MNNRFKFKLKENEIPYFEAIVKYLEVIGNKNSEDAINLVDNLFNHINNSSDDLGIFHEHPYYYAMSILYGKQQEEWWKDKEKWPIPEKYFKLFPYPKKE